MADTPQVNTADAGSGGADLAFKRFTSPTTADAGWCVLVYDDGAGGGIEVDAANPLPATVSGVSTAANQSTIIASNAAIQAAVEGTITVDGSGVTQPISAVSLPLPSGASTAANQATLVTSNAAIKTAVEGTLTVDGSGVTQPVSGTVTANLSAIDNAVLDTIAASAATIGTTDVTRVALFDAANAQITDFASQTTLATVSSNIATIAGAVGGTELQVDIVSAPTLTVDGSGVTQPVSGTVTANLSAVDNAVLDSIAAKDFATQTTLDLLYTTAGNIDSSTSGLSNTKVQIGLTDVLRVGLFDDADTQIGTSTTPVYVQGTMTANLSATDNAVLDAINASNAGMETDIDAINTNISTMTTDLGLIKSDIDNLDGCITAGVLRVDLGTDNDVQGTVAHDAADSGNPVKVGAVASGHAAVTAVAEGDRTNLRANVDGVLMTMGCNPNLRCVTVLVAAADGAQTNTGVITVGGGLIAVTRCSIQCSNANTVDVDVKVGFASSTLPTAATTGTALDLMHEAKAVPPGGGITIGDGSGIVGISGASGEDLRYSVSVPTGGHVSLSFTYFTIES